MSPPWLSSLGLCSPALRRRSGAAGQDSFYGELKQAPLTEDQVKNYIAAMADMQSAMGDAPADAAEPDAKTMTKLEDVAKQHGFKDFDEYNKVAGNVALVLDGDRPRNQGLCRRRQDDRRSRSRRSRPTSRCRRRTRKPRSRICSSNSSPPPPVANKGNIDLVVKYYDKLKNDE